MIDVVVSRKQLEARDIISLELTRNDGGILPAFSAGAHIDVHLPGGLVRQYSLCNPPGETHRYVIGVLREAHSRGGSAALHDVVAEGQLLKISEPRNNFALVPGAKRTVLFAGGIGITPLLCMAEQLSQVGAEFTLHYSARSMERLAFRERIEQSAYAKNTHFYVDDGLGAPRFDLASALAEHTPDTHIYVCGPAGFIEHVLTGAKERGWEDDQLHREYFEADPAVLAGPEESFQIQIASTGERFTVPEGRSVVDVLTDNGIEVLVSCEKGMCGSCVTGLVEVQGELDHRDMFLSPKQHAARNVFTPCCSRATSGSVLVLDL